MIVKNEATGRIKPIELGICVVLYVQMSSAGKMVSFLLRNLNKKAVVYSLHKTTQVSMRKFA
jgi:hypothetical protein